MFKTFLTVLVSMLGVLANPDVKRVVESDAQLWTLTLLGPQGETPSFTPEFADNFTIAESEDGLGARLSWTITIDRNSSYKVFVDVSLDSDLPKWSISADLPGGWTVTDVEFPRISVPRLDGAKVIVSAGYGAEYDIPVGGSIDSRYPSVTGGMQLMMVHNADGTLYYAADDKSGCGKTFRVSGTASSITFDQIVPASYAWTSPDGHFNLPWCTTLAYSSDSWEDTVLKWYRPFTFETQWGRRTISERPTVEWVRDADIWIRPKNVFPEVVDGLRKAVEYYGEGTAVHWYHWHSIPYDTMYPEYFPARDGFAELVKEIQSKGAHITPYTNGRLWDPSNDSYKALRGDLASCRKKDGSLYTELYPTSKVINTVTCPGSPIWQDVVCDFAAEVLNELGTDGLYIDQIGAAASEPCYATNHDHAPGGGCWWPESYRKIITRLREGVFDSAHAITTEENGECYIDLFDMMLIVNTPHGNGARMVPLFPLVYSDRCTYCGLNYYHQQLNDGHFLYNNARSLLWGAQLGWIQPEWLMTEENSVEIAFLKTLGEFRKKHHDLFVGGRFLGEVELGGDIPAITVMNNETFPVVMCSRWISGKGKEALLLVNVSAEKTVVILPDGTDVAVPSYSAIRINRQI